MEAMDVVQRQVDEYEDEIRALKDFKSPKRSSSGRTPRRTPQPSPGVGSSGAKSANADESTSSTGALEAALCRPALLKALQEVAYWKSKATASWMSELPPLPVLQGSPFGADGEFKERDADEALSSLVELSSAWSDYRLTKASVKIVDLTNSTKDPRTQLREQKARSAEATNRLETVILRCRGRGYL
jgi:hypothetical protein